MEAAGESLQLHEKAPVEFLRLAAASAAFLGEVQIGGGAWCGVVVSVIGRPF